jgi:hypothetical protein
VLVSKTGANINELFDSVVTEVTARFPEDAPGDQPQTLIKMGAVGYPSSFCPPSPPASSGARCMRGMHGLHGMHGKICMHYIHDRSR